jgi:hypothetical protein
MAAKPPIYTIGTTRRIVTLPELLDHIRWHMISAERYAPDTHFQFVYSFPSSREIVKYILQNKSHPYFELRLVPYESKHIHNLADLLSDVEKLTPEESEMVLNYFKVDSNLSGRLVYSETPNNYKVNVINYILQLKDASWLSIDKAVSQKPDYGFLAKYLDIPTYPLSGRPKTSMPFLSDLKSVVLETDMLVVDFGIFQNGSDFYVPVLRYAEDTTHGGYYAGQSGGKTYCGTFYYIDLDEDRYLRLGDFRIFRNKFAAYVGMKQFFQKDELRKMLVEKIGWIYERLVYDFDDPEASANPYIGTTRSSMFNNVINKLTSDITLQRQLLYDFMIEGKIISNQDGSMWYDPETNRDWLGNYIDKVYADEDRFDQSICIMAKHLGIDCIIFTHMVGRTQIVSELLDTRDRAVSYSSIVRFTR